MFSKLLRWILTALGLGYVASPIDLLPDILPGAGQMDDMAVVAGLAVYWLIYWMRRKKTGPATQIPPPAAR